MAQQPAANESTPPQALTPLHPAMEQQVGGRDPRPISTPSRSNTVIQSSVEDGRLSSSTSSSSSTVVQHDHDDESTPLLLSASQNSTVEQEHEGRVPDPRANFTSPRVEDESTQQYLSGQMHSYPEQHHEHTSSSLSPSEGLNSDIQHSVGDNSASNIFAQQANIRQHRPILLFDPTQSSIMIRRNRHAESASAGRDSFAQEAMQNVNPKRVKQLISALGFDDERSEMFYQLVIATAPFHDTGSLPTPPPLEDRNPEADALREALGSLMFPPNPASPTEYPTATTTAEGSQVENRTENPTENPTANLLFDADAAETLGSCPLETRPDSPPLVWSTAAAEESLDPDAEDPTYFTVAEFINTIVEKSIQVESVTDDDWWIEQIRVAILNRLRYDASEDDFAAEGNSNEVALTTEEGTEKLKAEGDFNEGIVTTEEATEKLKAEGDTNEIAVTTEKAIEKLEAKGDSNEVTVTTEEAAKELEAEEPRAREDTSKSDLQRWKEQGPDGWLKREDGTDMNEDEIDEECARWDEMVRNARREKEAEKAAPSTHDEDEELSQKKKKKGSKKNKNKNRKAKKNAMKEGDPKDVSGEVRDPGTFTYFLDLPRRVRNKVLGFILVVDQELVPYRYVKGKIVKNVGLRRKPDFNILLALCSSKDMKVKKCQDDAKNILYRDNTFSIRKPMDLIMFLDTIGSDNMARMKMGRNLLLADTFFDKKHRYVLEMKWLAHWGKDLLHAMKGHNIFRSDIAAESSDDDLTCEPMDIEKALKSMVEVMRDEGKMYEMLTENRSGSGNSPMRLKSLDLGEEFDSLADQIKTMGLAVGDGKVTKLDIAKMPEKNAAEDKLESMSDKWKRKARETGKVKDENEANGYGEFFLEAVASIDEEDDEDVLSQESGYYTPSVYSEQGRSIQSIAQFSTNMTR